MLVFCCTNRIVSVLWRGTNLIVCILWHESYCGFLWHEFIVRMLWHESIVPHPRPPPKPLITPVPYRLILTLGASQPAGWKHTNRVMSSKSCLNVCDV